MEVGLLVNAAFQTHIAAWSLQQHWWPSLWKCKNNMKKKGTYSAYLPSHQRDPHEYIRIAVTMTGDALWEQKYKIGYNVTVQLEVQRMNREKVGPSCYFLTNPVNSNLTDQGTSSH